MNRVIWSTLGTKGIINFSTEIEWNGSKISCNHLISFNYFDKPVCSTGKGNYKILLNTVELLKIQKDGKYLLLTYLSQTDLICQIFCELNESKPLELFSPKGNVRKPVLFILNPFGGTKAASKLFDRLIKPLIIISSLPYELMGKYLILNLETTHSKHAVSIAHDLDLDKYSGIVSISGDGVFHEIINGLFTRPDWRNIIDIPLGIIGAGTANAMSQNLNLNNPVRAFLAILKGKTTLLDIFSYYQPNHGTQFSHLSVGWGLIADLDIESESYRWLGSERFTVAALIRLMNFRTYSGTIYVLPAEKCSNNDKIYDINKFPVDYQTWPIRVEGNFKMFLASNFPWISKDFKVSTNESLNSGSMHVIWSHSLSTFQGLSVLLNPSKGEWINRPEFSNVFAKSLVLGKCY